MHHIGSYRSKDQSYSLAFYLGIEQWENGKRTTHRYQRWWFSCSFPDILTGARRTRCSVERLVIDAGAGVLPMHVSQHNHTVDDDSLRINAADWGSGKLDLTLTFSDQNTADLALRFKKIDSGLYFTSFKGVGIAKGFFKDSDPAIVEYKVPPYTYTLNIPLEMTGVDDAGVKLWDDVFALLDERDKLEWNRLNSSRAFAEGVDKVGLPELKERLKRRYPDLDLDAVEKGQRKLTNDENAILGRLTAEVMADLLVKQVQQASFSRLGRERIVAYLNAHVRNAQ